jgi:hypothetical protein
MALPYCSLHRRVFRCAQQCWLAFPQETIRDIRGYYALLGATTTPRAETCGTIVKRRARAGRVLTQACNSPGGASDRRPCTVRAVASALPSGQAGGTTKAVAEALQHSRPLLVGTQSSARAVPACSPLQTPWGVDHVMRVTVQALGRGRRPCTVSERRPTARAASRVPP